jgi:hypothetical protein
MLSEAPKRGPHPTPQVEEVVEILKTNNALHFHQQAQASKEQPKIKDKGLCSSWFPKGLRIA